MIVHNFNILGVPHRKQMRHWSLILILIWPARFPFNNSRRFPVGFPRCILAWRLGRPFRRDHQTASRHPYPECRSDNGRAPIECHRRTIQKASRGRFIKKIGRRSDHSHDEPRRFLGGFRQSGFSGERSRGVRGGFAYPNRRGHLDVAKSDCPNEWARYCDLAYQLVQRKPPTEISQEAAGRQHFAENG